MKPKNRKPTATVAEKEQIYLLLDDYTDEEIADKFNIFPVAIRNLRRRRSLHEVKDKRDDSITLLRGKHYWPKIREQLLDDEIGFFEQEWASYNLQFQDLVHTDELTMIDTIMLTIQINRLLVQQKQSLDEINRTTKLLNIELKLDENEQNPMLIKTYREVLTGLQVVLRDISKQIESNQVTKDRKFSQLKVTRDQRFKKIEESKKNVFELLKLLDEYDSRAKENRTLSLMKDATAKIKKEWMEPTEFPDGSRDSILLSEETVEYLENKEDE